MKQQTLAMSQIAESSDPSLVGTAAEHDAKMSVDLDKLKSDQLDLREKLLSLRENELLTLRHDVQELSTRFKLALLVGAILTTLLGVAGVKKFGDLSDLIDKTMLKRIDDSLGYYDQASKAILLSNSGNCAGATPLLSDLADKRPEDEVVFGYLSSLLSG